MRHSVASALAIIACALAVSPTMASDLSAPETPNQQLLKTDLLVVTAHPDDESMMAATMARYADEGKVVALATCTHGEGGGNGTGKESGMALGMVREAELRKCLGILGVRHLYFLHQLDWAYTESVQATFAKWGHDESLKRLVRVVRLLRPEIICTMNPAPVGGQHGHHQAAGRLATEVFEAAADPKQFPELLRDEGLAPWRVRKLYWTSFGPGGTVQIATSGEAKGALVAAHKGKRYTDIGWEAARQHRSQGFDKFLASTTGTARPPARPNGFLLVKSRVHVNPRAEQDLFDGIAGAKVDGPDAEHDVIAATLPAEILPPVTAQLRPRDNLRNFREWLKANGISRLMPQIPVHATLFSSVSPHTFEFEVQNNTNSVQRGVVFLDKGKDWPEWQDGGDFELPAGGNATIKAKGMYPSEELIGLGSHEVKVRVNSVVSSGFIDLVPTMGIPRQNTLPEVTADPDKWGPIGSGLKIAHTNLVQGQIKSPDECSGRFFVGWDDIDVQVLVDVTDDTVATNISPDDLKAHWRSTSVEICIDPTPFSENTFSTLKLGIFPQDASGKVRAARDADARPGPLERIGSKIKLASRMTPAGYVVEARIPWAEIYNDATRKPKKRDALGFNVIIYHAGAKQARVGEDIGKARLAWSYYRGVPGRPEVWGLAILK